MFECVVNISEGRDLALLDELANCAQLSLRDRHSDAFHHRSVFTLINQPEPLLEDLRGLVHGAFDRLDLRTHHGVHPRFGVVDVVPFVALDRDRRQVARAMRDDTARWIAATFAVPTFLYGPFGVATRTLPEVRRDAFATIGPDFGPSVPSLRLGATAVGARPVLVAWNLWLRGVSVKESREIASAVRQPAVRAMGFDLGEFTQVSCNLIDPTNVAPSDVYDEVQRLLPEGGEIARAELVGLVPASVLNREDVDRWDELGISPDQTIESRL